MKMEGKVDAAVKWAKTWPELNEFLKLNAILTDDDQASFTTVYGDAKGKPYIDGTAQHTFTFGLRMMLPWSDGYDSTNARAELLIERWRDWVDAQFPANVPDWGETEIEGIEALYDVPAVTVYQDEAVAEYSFQAKITYTE